MDLIGFRERNSFGERLTRMLECAVPETREELRNTVFLFARGGIPLAALGEHDVGKEPRDARATAEALKQHCIELETGVRNGSLADMPEARRLIAILGKQVRALDDFLGGKQMAVIAPDVGELPATLDAADVRSAFRSLGVDDDTLRRVRGEAMRSGLVHEYAKHSLIGPDTIEFLIRGIPVDAVEYFLGLFTPEELDRYMHIINSPMIALSLAADPLDYEYLEFVAALVRTPGVKVEVAEFAASSYERLYPELDWTKPQYTLKAVHDALPGTSAQKRAYIDEHARALSLDEMAYLIRLPAQEQDAFRATCEEYDGIFEPSDIIALLANSCDLREAKELFTSLPELMRYAPFVVAMMTEWKGYSKEKLQEFIAAYDLYEPENSFSSAMVLWYFEHYEKAKADIAAFHKRGVWSLYDIYQMSSDGRVPAEYWIDMCEALDHTYYDSEQRGCIAEWHEHGITKTDVVACAGLWDEKKGVPWHVVDSASIKAYLAVRADPSKSTVLDAVCEAHDVVPSEIIIQVYEGYGREDFERIHSRGLMTGMLPLFKAYPELGEIFDGLDEKRQGAFLDAALSKDLDRALAVSGQVAETVHVLIEARMRDESVGTADAYAEFLERRSSRHAEYTRLFGLFGVTPEYMAEKMALAARSRELDDVVVNHILLCAYAEGKMAPEFVSLVEHNRISFFTRYPAAVLRAMAAGYADAGMERERVCIYLSAKSDWNGASDQKEDSLAGIFAVQEVHIYEVATKGDFYGAMRDLGGSLEKNSKRMSLVYFAGHGNNELVQLGFPYSPSRTELKKNSVNFLAPLRRFLADDAQLVLASCSAAKDAKESHTLAHAFAEAWPGVEVFGSNSNTATSGVTFDADARVTSVRFNEPSMMEVIKIPRM